MYIKKIIIYSVVLFKKELSSFVLCILVIILSKIWVEKFPLLDFWLTSSSSESLVSSASSNVVIIFCNCFINLRKDSVISITSFKLNLLCLFLLFTKLFHF